MFIQQRTNDLLTSQRIAYKVSMIIKSQYKTPWIVFWRTSI